MAVASAGRKGRSLRAQVKEGRKLNQFKSLGGANLNEEGRILQQISLTKFFFKVGMGAQYFILARGAPTPRYGHGQSFHIFH
jgi:hypothetical protein